MGAASKRRQPPDSYVNRPWQADLRLTRMTGLQPLNPQYNWVANAIDKGKKTRVNQLYKWKLNNERGDDMLQRKAVSVDEMCDMLVEAYANFLERAVCDDVRQLVQQYEQHVCDGDCSYDEEADCFL